MKENLFSTYKPGEHEAEKASNGYLMSMVAVIAGLPLPIVNLAASFFFFIGHRKDTNFVRWHTLQAFLSQFGLFFLNSFCFWWTISIIFSSNSILLIMNTFSSEYFAYLICVIVLNLLEFIGNIRAAIKTRKGEHFEFWVFGSLTNLLFKEH